MHDRQVLTCGRTKPTYAKAGCLLPLPLPPMYRPPAVSASGRVWLSQVPQQTWAPAIRRQGCRRQGTAVDQRTLVWRVGACAISSLLWLPGLAASPGSTHWPVARASPWRGARPPRPALADR